MKVIQLLPLLAIIACGDKETDTFTVDNTEEETADEPIDDTDTDTDTDIDTDDSDDETDDIANGQSIHDNMCMNCHASNQAMADRVPNMTDEQITDVVQNGIGNMAAQPVDAEDLPDLIAFLRQEYP